MNPTLLFSRLTKSSSTRSEASTRFTRSQRTARKESLGYNDCAIDNARVSTDKDKISLTSM